MGKKVKVNLGLRETGSPLRIFKVATPLALGGYKFLVRASAGSLLLWGCRISSAAGLRSVVRRGGMSLDRSRSGLYVLRVWAVVRLSPRGGAYVVAVVPFLALVFGPSL